MVQKFVLAKVPTPADTRSAITRDVQPNASHIKFVSYEAALEQAKTLIRWKEPTTVQHQQGTTGWRMQMMYNHCGLGTQFVELGEMGPVPYTVANEEAKKRAQSFANDCEEVEGWETRVRPFQRSTTPAQNGTVNTPTSSGSVGNF